MSLPAAMNFAGLHMWRGCGCVYGVCTRVVDATGGVHRRRELVGRLVNRQWRYVRQTPTFTWSLPSRMCGIHFPRSQRVKQEPLLLHRWWLDSAGPSAHGCSQPAGSSKRTTVTPVPHSHHDTLHSRASRVRNVQRGSLSTPGAAAHVPRQRNVTACQLHREQHRPHIRQHRTVRASPWGAQRPHSHLSRLVSA